MRVSKLFVQLTVLLAVFLLQSSMALGQNRPPFNPEKFEADMERFITKEAGLSSREAARFFPMFREMQNKQRALFKKMRGFRHVDTNDDMACMRAIRMQDNIDIQIKKIQQRYHQKFLKILPAGKVMRIIKAEEKFHRISFARAMKNKKRC
ncbi:MAG: hypothetical protein ACOYJF_00325 [Prevotella sp.]|jgi:hypothetical protein